MINKQIKDQEQILKAIKNTVLELKSKGISFNDIANVIAKHLSPEVARLVMIDLALDLGMEKETSEYLNKF